MRRFAFRIDDNGGIHVGGRVVAIGRGEINLS